MFALDPRLEQDTLLLGDFPLSRLLLMNDARYPWFILVPRREDVTELFQLDVDDQQALWREATLLAEVLKDTFRADKMNVANLGNVVSQLHMHVIVPATWRRRLARPCLGAPSGSALFFRAGRGDPRQVADGADRRLPFCRGGLDGAGRAHG
ncbi:histidine triad (HIT) protein [Pseudomonas aeruginosa]|nr:histidine triad (HIT) protein [Pseudomonas aeruginosa]